MRKESAFLERSSVHGLDEVFSSSRSCFHRIFWALVVCGGFAFMSGGLVKVLLSFMDHPVSTEFAVISAARYQIPNITLCPKRFIDWQKATQLSLRSVLAKCNFRQQVNFKIKKICSNHTLLTVCILDVKKISLRISKRFVSNTLAMRQPYIFWVILATS